MKTRQKHIRIATSSIAWWKAINEKWCNEIANIFSVNKIGSQCWKLSGPSDISNTGHILPPTAAVGSSVQMAFPVVSNMFLPFSVFNSSNKTHFRIDSQGDNLCHTTFVWTILQLSDESSTAQKKKQSQWKVKKIAWNVLIKK